MNTNASNLRWRGSVLALLAAGVRLGAAEIDPAKLPPAADVKIVFERDIKPIFESTCWRCHGPEKPKSHLRLDNRESALKGGDNGVDILPGNSAKSPLIHYVARLVPDLEMPPEGKGQPLTPAQVGLLRAWIDQGAPWAGTPPASQSAFSFAPAFRWIGVSGDQKKFRELEGIPEGAGGGLENFSMSQQFGPDKKISVEGRALFPEDDVRVKLTLEKTDLGFVRGGFEQWRRYYDDTGGYYRPFSPPSFDLNRDLHLDIGRAWIDFGLTLPRWPQIVLGYEYQFKDGAKSTLEWGPVNGKNIYPASEQISEHTHILKLDVTHDVLGWHLDESARVEFYDLNTRHDDAASFSLGPAPDSLVQTREGFTHIQGMNTFRLERELADWWLISGGYLYSQFDGDASFDQTTVDPAGVPARGNFWSSDQIQLKHNNHVFSATSLLRPVAGLSLSLGLQREWQHQEVFGDINLDTGDPNIPAGFNLAPTIVHSDLDTRTALENADLRFTSIPYTVLFAGARLEQENISQFEQQMDDVGGAFLRDTDATNDRRDFRAGFNTSPWRWMELSGYYRNRRSDTDYDHLRREFTNNIGGYSAFIRQRRIAGEEVEAKLVLRPVNWLRTTLTYQIGASDFWTTTDPVSGGITPGGTIFAGNYDAQVYGLNVTLSPGHRFQFSGAFTYSDSRTLTAVNHDPSLAPYQGDIFTVTTTASYTLNPATRLYAAYSFSRADFAQDNVVAGLPLGLNYTRHGLMAGITRKMTDYLTASLRYGFYDYDEPVTGGVNNYIAHGVFGMIVVKWP